IDDPYDLAFAHLLMFSHAIIRFSYGLRLPGTGKIDHFGKVAGRKGPRETLPPDARTKSELLTIFRYTHLPPNRLEIPRGVRGRGEMRAESVGSEDIVRLSDYTGELARLRQCDDDDRIDRAFNEVCRRIWGYVLDDFDDESLDAKDHAFLDRLTWKRAAAFARENGYDLVDRSSGNMVPDWWGFAWMILAEKRGLLTPQGRAATWRRHAAPLHAKP